MVILGIDPGLGATGYGAIDAANGQLQLLGAGEIRTKSSRPLAERLSRIHEELGVHLNRWQPAVVVLEKLYTHHARVTTASKMGHARGVACLAAEQHEIPVVEYPSNRIKQAITGHGTASKDQVARMVRQWLNATELRSPKGEALSGAEGDWSFDATDALALAIAHAQMETQHQRSALFHYGRRRPVRTGRG